MTTLTRAGRLIKLYNESGYALHNEQTSLTEAVNVDIDEVKALGKQLIPFDDSKMGTFIKWIAHFPKSGRAPKGEKKLFDTIKFLHTQVDLYNDHGLLSPNINASLSWWDAEEMDRIADVFFAGKTKAKLEVIKHGTITFHNGSSMGEARFKKTAKTIADLLKRLKGFHKKALSKPLEIHFKYAKEMKARAVYKGLLDQVWVKESSKPDNELYGHLLYIIVHELGHRYEKLHGAPRDFRDAEFITTSYSKTDSLAGSETFAEIFALSFWPEKYTEYEDQITRFNKLMK